MKLPPKRKTNDPILASDWNLLIDAIAARTPRPGCGLSLISTAGGFAYSRQSPESATGDPSRPPFAVIAINRGDSGYQVTLCEGWVIERKPKYGDAPVVKFHMPVYDGVALDTVPRPQIAMTIGDTLWCKYETDVAGAITGTPELIVSAAELASTHYQPANPEDSEDEGTAGIYHVKLIKLEYDSGDPAAKAYQQSDIEHWAQLWTGGNVGDYGEGVFKKHDAPSNSYQFRKIHGVDGVDVALNGEHIEISLSGAAGLTGYVRYTRLNYFGVGSTYGYEGLYYYYFHKFVNGHLTAVYESGSSTPPEDYGDMLHEILMNNYDV